MRSIILLLTLALAACATTTGQTPLMGSTNKALADQISECRVDLDDLTGRVTKLESEQVKTDARLTSDSYMLDDLRRMAHSPHSTDTPLAPR